MDEVNKIRKDYFSREKNRNQISEKSNRSWATVNSYVTKSPEEIKSLGKRPNRISHVKNEEVVQFILDHLQEEIDKNVKPKQRYSAYSLFRKACEKEIFNGTDRYFRSIVQEQRILFQQLKKPPKCFLELDFPLGKYLQIDHGPVEVELDSIRFDAYLFSSSVPGATIRFCQVYLTKAQESWGDFYEKCFQFYGGIFSKTVTDNDSVLKVPSTEELTEFALQLQNHYGLKIIFCNKSSGWEKGAVENSVGACRRNFLPGLPSFPSLEELNSVLIQKCREHIEEEKHYQTEEPLKDIEQKIKNNLLPLTPSFSWGIWEELPVNSFQCITYKGHRYSVPQRFVGFKVKVFISSSLVNILEDDQLVASHSRIFTQGKDSLQLEHYLDQLEKKPRSIPFAKVMLSQKFPEYLKEIHARLRNRLPINKADVEFIKILKERRKCPEKIFEMAIKLGLSFGGVTHSAINSFIKQLELSQHSPLCPKELLPPHCPIGWEKHFDLSVYNQLENERRI